MGLLLSYGLRYLPVFIFFQTAGTLLLASYVGCEYRYIKSRGPGCCLLLYVTDRVCAARTPFPVPFSPLFC